VAVSEDPLNPYRWTVDAHGRARGAIACPRCGAVSYSPRDVAERYCGRCHQFHEFFRVEVELITGRVIDLSGLSPAVAIARLHALGVTPADIRATRHFIPAGTLPKD
jgi:ribosomal protein S27AE